ncbi:MAG: hypothetical protein D6689_10405 [Deltaproteobacteria bacterium]|nr:MAG: hypothetical protein D6689_10405 [Deltaproteobacteria bacterium]
MTADADTSRISPTAHYTGYVWWRNGLSYDALRTPLGRALYAALAPANAVYRRVARRADLEQLLLARHRIIDHRLAAAIEAGRVRQVVEIAGGLSARGVRMAARYRDRGLVYVEGDLPDMAEAKRARLARAGLLADNHRVVPLNALVDDGDHSLRTVAGRLLDPTAGTAIVTEGLTAYFAPDVLAGMWQRIAACLSAFPAGLYLADIILGSDAGPARRAFGRALGWFARGDVYLHFSGPDECIQRLRACGFATAELLHPADFASAGVPEPDRGHIVRVIEATT